MIGWLTVVEVAIALVAGLACLVLGLVGRRPADLTMGTTLLVELVLVVQVVVAIVSPLAGNPPSGSPLEYWIYLVSALLLPPVAVFWALVDRTRWSTVVLGVAGLAVAVMLYRMWEIWVVQRA